MRHLIAGLLILALIAALCAGTLGYERRCLGEALSLADRALDRSAAGDAEGASVWAEEACLCWREALPRLSLLMPLRDLGELDRCFENALRALERDSDNAPDMLCDLCSLLRITLQRERFSWENIF